MDSIQAFLDAVKSGDLDTIKDLVDAQPNLKDARTIEGISALMLSLYYRQAAVSEYLLAQKANLDIFEAAATGKVGQVITLIDAQPNRINLFSPDGFTPLGLAAYFGQPDVVEALIQRGANVNTPSQNAQSVAPLHSAVAGGHLAIVEMLLKAGADVNAVQQDGFTPLHGAVNNRQLAMVMLLLTFGADKTLATVNGQTALAMATTAPDDSQGGHAEIIALLEA